MRIRNSPTKPLRPGSAIDDSITTVNAAANTGATFCSPLSAAISRVWRRSTIMPDQQEEGAGADAVVDHLQHAAGHATGA